MVLPIKAVAFAALWTIVAATAAAQPAELRFTDVAEPTGLRDHVAGMQSHVASWADLTGDDRPELLVGSWGMKDLQAHADYQAPGPPVPGRLYRQVDGRFVFDPDRDLQITGHATAAVFVDLDNDGRLDLYVSNHRPDEPNQLFRNDGDGRFTDISAESNACPDDQLTSRAVGVLDYDGDSLVDLLVLEGDRAPQRSRLYRNMGDLQFRDVTASAGLPTDLAGLGIAVGDLTGNGFPDLVVTGMEYTRVFLSNGDGTYREDEGVRPQLRWERRTGDDKMCGAALADLDRDGRLDLIIGHHDKQPWRTPKPITVLLNRGVRDGGLVLRDIGEAAGFAPLGTKAPHVEAQDFDNDGWLDVYVSIVVRGEAGEDVQPVIYRSQGMRDGIPRFDAPALRGVDFPQPEHAEMDVHQIAAEAPLRYYGFGPSGDFDRDGRIDMALVSWWPRLDSYLLRNTTESDNRYLRVRVQGRARLNHTGIGAKVYLYEPGRLGEPQALLGFREITTGYGYASGQEAIAHFGLGQRDRCDLLVQLPHGGPAIEHRDVEANQTLVVHEP